MDQVEQSYSGSMKVELEIVDATVALPEQGTAVLLWFEDGCVIGARYGDVWREYQFGEDELRGVMKWALVPEFARSISF
jgi:hypothetical protein